MELITEKDLEKLEQVNGGFANVSDPIYSLTSDEQSILSSSGYKLNRTNSGNFRVYYSNGTTIEPHVLENMCNVIAKARDKYKRSW